MARRELCTYLDLQYLDKGIAMFESLCHHLHRTSICAWSASTTSVSASSATSATRGSSPCTASELERADPDLLSTRIQRSQVEYMVDRDAVRVALLSATATDSTRSPTSTRTPVSPIPSRPSTASATTPC